MNDNSFRFRKSIICILCTVTRQTRMLKNALSLFGLRVKGYRFGQRYFLGYVGEKRGELLLTYSIAEVIGHSFPHIFIFITDHDTCYNNYITHV